MEIVLSNKVTLWKKFNTLVNFNLHERKNYFLNNQDLMSLRLRNFNPTKIKIGDDIFQVVPAIAIIKANPIEDNHYRYMYIQINAKTNEYYLGSLNRRKWNEAKHFTTPELKLEGKHPDYQGDFIRLFFAPCNTDRELASLQEKLLATVITADPKCLNNRKNIDTIMDNEKHWKLYQVKGELSELDILGSFFDYELTHQEKAAPAPKAAAKQAAPVQDKPHKSSSRATCKAIDMLDLTTGEVLRQFASQKDAAAWLVQEGKAKSLSCASSVSAVCRGAGNRKQAYGYKWAYADK